MTSFFSLSSFFSDSIKMGARDDADVATATIFLPVNAHRMMFVDIFLSHSSFLFICLNRLLYDDEKKIIEENIKRSNFSGKFIESNV